MARAAFILKNNLWISHVAQGVKDPALSLQLPWQVCDPRPGSFHRPQVPPKKKKKKKSIEVKLT